MKFTGHAKRVTLNLARQSAVVAKDYPELLEALHAAAAVNYKLEALEKPLLELIYAHFDADLEKAVRDEFVADPNYLEDWAGKLGDRSCPLCGHPDCRWIFRLENIAGGQAIRCGSECIVTYGLQVKGAETAEHAKKMLQSRIRQEIKKLKIEAWHKDYDFDFDYFQKLFYALKEIRKDYSQSYSVRHTAYCHLYQLHKLNKFYLKSGWLNTEKRWNDYRRVAKFVLDLEPEVVPYPIYFQKKEKKSAKKAEILVTPKKAKILEFGQTKPKPIYQPKKQLDMIWGALKSGSKNQDC